MCSLRPLHYADAIPDPFGGYTTALTLEQPAATRLEAARYMVVAEGAYRLAAGLELLEEL